MCQANITSSLHEDWDPLSSYGPDFTLRPNNMEWSLPTAICLPTLLLPQRTGDKNRNRNIRFFSREGPTEGSNRRQEHRTARGRHTVVLGKLQKYTIVTSRVPPVWSKGPGWSTFPWSHLLFRLGLRWTVVTRAQGTIFPEVSGWKWQPTLWAFMRLF